MIKHLCVFAILQQEIGKLEARKDARILSTIKTKTQRNAEFFLWISKMDFPVSVSL